MGRRTTPSRTLKMALLPPIPRASATTAAAVNPGERASVRSAYRRSWRKESTRPDRAKFVPAVEACIHEQFRLERPPTSDRSRDRTVPQPDNDRELATRY